MHIAAVVGAGRVDVSVARRSPRDPRPVRRPGLFAEGDAAGRRDDVLSGTVGIGNEEPRRPRRSGECDPRAIGRPPRAAEASGSQEREAAAIGRDRVDAAPVPREGDLPTPDLGGRRHRGHECDKSDERGDQTLHSFDNRTLLFRDRYGLRKKFC